MRVRSVAVVLLVLAVFLPQLCFAQSTERAAARAGLEAYNKGDYALAMKKFKEAEAGAEGLQTTERLLVYKYLAYCEIAFGKKADAKAHFLQALELDPNLKLDATLVSPKVLVVFEEAKAAVAAAAATPTPVIAATPRPTSTSVAIAPTPTPGATPIGAATPRPTPPPPSGAGFGRGKAAMYSAMAPGLGQFMSGRKITGGVFAGAAATSLVGAVYLHSQASTAESYIDKAGPEERSKMYGQAKSFSSQRDMMIGLFALTWAGSVGEAYLRTPSSRPRRVVVAPMLDPSGGGGSVLVFAEF